MQRKTKLLEIKLDIEKKLCAVELPEVQFYVTVEKFDSQYHPQQLILTVARGSDRTMKMIGFDQLQAEITGQLGESISTKILCTKMKAAIYDKLQLTPMEKLKQLLISAESHPVVQFPEETQDNGNAQKSIGIINSSDHSSGTLFSPVSSFNKLKWLKEQQSFIVKIFLSDDTNFARIIVSSDELLKLRSSIVKLINKRNLIDLSNDEVFRLKELVDEFSKEYESAKAEFSNSSCSMQMKRREE